MLQIPTGQTTEGERDILRKLRVWIAALAVACVLIGIGIGAMLAGKQAVAQSEAQKDRIARAPEALSASFAEIAKTVEPAVVNIDTISAPQQLAQKNGNKNSDEEDGEDADNPLLDMLRNRARRPSRGVGSGFIVDPKGLILTNQHVVEGADRITVKLQSGETLRGEVVGIDDETDLAVVRVKSARDLPFVKLGNSDDALVGDWVLAIGSPFGLEQTVTAGIISTKERLTPGASSFQRFLQTDAAINRGNSGGPLVNMRGEVIGVNSQIATSTGDYNGIGFALPSNIADSVFRQITSVGKVRRGYLGIFLDPIKPEFARVYNLPDTKGAIIRDIADAQSPAAKAGLQTNDIIVEINGQPITGAQDLINKVASTGVGQTMQVTYLREANNRLERHAASVQIGERPPRASAVLEAEDKPDTVKPEPKETPKSDRPVLGLTLSELTPQIANERNLKGVRGLFVKEIDQAGLAFEAGLRKNMVVQRVNRAPVNSLADFESIVGKLKLGDPIVMHVAVYNGDRILQNIVQFTFQ
ncbi:MAG: Do family serine endopeptidase [Acidobacteria bacterium]|nr:Do family serine endopeptidase [Acidobacteriota bacterium]